MVYIINTILQSRKLRHREGRKLAQSHIGVNDKTGIKPSKRLLQNPAFISK